MSQNEPQRVKLSAGQRWIIGLTFVGTLGLSIFGKPTIAFALVGLGTLLLLLLGSDIGRVTIKLLGAEAIIERAQRAEQDALKAAQEAKDAIAALEKTTDALKELGGVLATFTLTEAIIAEDFEHFLLTALEGRNMITESLEKVGFSADEIREIYFPVNLAMIRKDGS